VILVFSILINYASLDATKQTEQKFIIKKLLLLNKNAMTISILTDNYPGSHTMAEHGLSYLIEYDGMKILFDAGQSDLFSQNAVKMGIDLSDTDVIVLSHGHFDHGNGLKFINKGRMICHPDCFVNRYRNTDDSYIGLDEARESVNKRIELHESKEFIKITDKIFFLGEIPRITDFESVKTSFRLEGGEPDYVRDDSGLALLTDEGIFMITGCGHAGIVNTLEHARKITGETRISGIIGGFHLKKDDIQTRKTIQYLKENNVNHVLPSHCTDLPALILFYNAFKIKTIKTGMILNF